MVPETLPETHTPVTSLGYTKDITVFIGLAISGTLDVSLLKDKATEFVTQWPILGGRIITKAVPYSFTTGTTVDFQSRTLDIRLDDLLPIDITTSCSGPVRYPSYKSKTPDESIFHFNALDDFNLLQPTIFALRVTILQDATLLGFRVPHALCNASSAFQIVAAYRDLVAGQPILKLTISPDAKVPLSTLIQGQDDLPKTVSVVPYSDPEKKYTFGALPLLRFVGGFLLNTIAEKIGLTESGQERYIHLPKALIESWWVDSQAELDAAAASGKLQEGAGLQLTKNDIIAAWFIKKNYARTISDDDPIEFIFGLNYTFLLPPPENGTTYLHNSSYAINTHFPSLRQLQASSLAQIALMIRISVVRAKQPSSVRDNLAFVEATAGKMFTVAKAGTPTWRMPLMSSWTECEYNRMNWGAALVSGSGGDGNVVWTQPYVAFFMGLSIRPFVLTLKDGKGGYWVKANMFAEGWKGHGVE